VSAATRYRERLAESKQNDGIVRHFNTCGEDIHDGASAFVQHMHEHADVLLCLSNEYAIYHGPSGKMIYLGSATMKRTVASALGFGDRTRYCEVAPGVTMREENSRFEVVSALVLETDRSSIVEKMFTPPVKRKVSGAAMQCDAIAFNGY